jgi:hypothetical protein
VPAERLYVETASRYKRRAERFKKFDIEKVDTDYPSEAVLTISLQRKHGRRVAGVLMGCKGDVIPLPYQIDLAM